MSVKLIPDKDFHDYYYIFSNAYPGNDWSYSEDQIQQYTQERIKVQHANDGGGYYGCYRDGKLSGVMRKMNRQMRILSQTLTVGCLGAVAVDLFHRKERVAKKLKDSQ